MNDQRKIQLKLTIDARMKLQIPSRIATFKPKEKVLVTIESIRDE